MRNNKGFSLIELSIVLIILGLLVAGVTGGASLIKSAQIRSLVSELENYRNAYNTYYAQEDDYLKIDTDPWKELADKKIIDKTTTGAYLGSSYKGGAWSFNDTNKVYGETTALALTDKSGAAFLDQDEAKKILTKTMGDTNPANASTIGSEGSPETVNEIKATGCAVTTLTGKAQDVSVKTTGDSGNESTKYILLYRLNLN